MMFRQPARTLQGNTEFRAASLGVLAASCTSAAADRAFRALGRSPRRLPRRPVQTGRAGRPPVAPPRTRRISHSAVNPAGGGRPRKAVGERRWSVLGSANEPERQNGWARTGLEEPHARERTWQALDGSGWERPVRARRSRRLSLPLLRQSVRGGPT